MTPYTTNECGQGPAWSNSLFEDNAEYGYGMYIANRTKRQHLASLVEESLAKNVGSDSLQALLNDWLEHMAEGEGTQQRATKLAAALSEEADEDPLLTKIYEQKDLLVKTSQWIVGGDGWAYDIGFSGIDHVLASGEDVNILLWITKCMPIQADKHLKLHQLQPLPNSQRVGNIPLKRFRMMAITYGNVYVAQVALGANSMQTIKAIDEAERYQPINYHRLYPMY